MKKVGKLNWTVFEFVPVLQFYRFRMTACVLPFFQTRSIFQKGFHQHQLQHLLK